MLWLIIPVVVFTYFYGVVTVGKYSYYSDKLNFKSDKKASDNAIPSGLLWFVLLAIGDPAAKGLLYPSLRMWPKFREEWPAIQTERKRAEERKTEIRKKQERRERELKLGEITLGDAKEQVKHDRVMAVINRDIEGFQAQSVNDYPPEIGEDDHYDLDYNRIVNNPALGAKKVVKEETETEDGGEPEVYCTRHKHFVSLEHLDNPNNYCTDKGSGAL